MGGFFANWPLGADARFAPLADTRPLRQNMAMKFPSVLAAILSAALTGLAFRADGASLGTIVTSAAVMGVAVLLTARRSSSTAFAAVVGLVYLGALSLISVAASLIDKTIGQISDERLLRSSLVLVAIGLGWMVCEVILKRFQPASLD